MADARRSAPHAPARDPPSSRSRHSDTKLKKFMGAILSVCTYNATQTYEARQDINKIRAHLGHHLSEIPPPPQIPVFSDSEGEGDTGLADDEDTLADFQDITRRRSAATRPARFTATTHRAGRAVVSSSEEDEDHEEEEATQGSDSIGDWDD